VSRSALRAGALGALVLALVSLPIAASTASREHAPAAHQVNNAPPPPYLVAPLVLIEPRKVVPERDPFAGRPVRLVIPALDVTAPIIGVDAPEGVLTPPGDPELLGWWRGGAVPGARTGSSLVTGHTVHAGDAPMNDLEHLVAGDDVLVDTDVGRISYVVTFVRIFRKASLAQSSAQIFSQSVPGRLVLITCEDWDGEKYLSNVVVIAVPVRSE
jgi:LPXTG-site transpeptidase (sortase) family protein